MSKSRLSPRLGPVVSVAVCALWFCGCSARGELDALEADLRSKDQALTELQTQLVSKEAELKVARRDAEALRSELSQGQSSAIAAEQAEVLYKVEGIKFHSLLTSGQSRDGIPGDEGISALLMPVDMHGELVKLAGDVELELFDMSLPAENQRLGTWKFSTAEVREHWHRGIIGSGYFFQVDWQNVPAARELTLHARLQVPDGRKFDATTQVKIVPPGAGDAVAGEESDNPQAAAVQKVKKTGLRTRAMRPAAATEPPAQTSDRWTEESIPTLR